jgi:hypothetical protein
MEIKGNITHVLDVKTGQGANGEWTLQSWVLKEDEGQYPKDICFQAFNKHFDLKVGQSVTAHINIESKEHNDRWFTNISCWKVDFNGAQQPTAPPPPDPAAEIPPAPDKTETPSENNTEPEMEEPPF